MIVQSEVAKNIYTLQYVQKHLLEGKICERTKKIAEKKAADIRQNEREAAEKDNCYCGY